MKEINGDIWDYHKKGYWVVITTNGYIRKDGACVMGRGVAKEAARKFPMLPFEIGRSIQQFGNHVFACNPDTRIIAFPVKHNWWEKADIQLIERSCQELAEFPQELTYYMVRPGCGNGGLDWLDVKPVLKRYLDDRFIVVERYG